MEMSRRGLYSFEGFAPQMLGYDDVFQHCAHKGIGYRLKPFSVNNNVVFESLGYPRSFFSALLEGNSSNADHVSHNS